MALTETEKKKRRKEANRRYYEKLKAKAKSGDDKAIKQRQRNAYKTKLGRTKSFIENDIKKQDIPLIRDLIAKRVIQLKNEK